MTEINDQKIAELQLAMKETLGKFSVELTHTEIVLSVMEFAAMNVFALVASLEMPEKESYEIFYDLQAEMLTCFKEFMTNKEEIRKFYSTD